MFCWILEGVMLFRDADNSSLHLPPVQKAIYTGNVMNDN
uniref:Uncharacterized protein n=1 Tax=Anguilla anguilla TaxID=7936 RepID=A0A0E9SY52_ANGAN